MKLRFGAWKGEWKTTGTSLNERDQYLEWNRSLWSLEMRNKRKDSRIYCCFVKQSWHNFPNIKQNCKYKSPLKKTKQKKWKAKEQKKKKKIPQNTKIKSGLSPPPKTDLANKWFLKEFREWKRTLEKKEMEK